MKKILFVVLINLFLRVSYAQVVPGNSQEKDKVKGIGEIRATVMDSAGNKPIEYVTVTLINLVTDKPVDGTVTNEKGKFEIVEIPEGEFKLSLNFIGYKTKEIKSLTISKDISKINLTVIILVPDAEQLKEVVVQGQRKLIEEKVDRTVYNAEFDATARGGDATDVLKRVPMLTVDNDGNVSLRGNQNIKVLINNRPSTITAGSIADALKQIPADQIKTVEVITSPSARYDAEGSSGIINIILKKNTLEGFFLNVDGSVGIRGSNLGLNSNYNKKKMKFSLGGFGRAGYNIPGTFTNRQLTRNRDNTLLLLNQDAHTKTQMMFGNYTLGWDYDISEHNFISSSVKFSGRNMINDQNRLHSITTYGDSSTNNFRNVHVTDLSNTVDVNFNYTHNFKKPQQEFNLLGLYSVNQRSNDFVNEIFENNGLPFSSTIRNQNPSSNKEATIQADFQTPVGKSQLLELGAKEIVRLVSSRYIYNFYNGHAGTSETAGQNSLNNTFNYNQNVTAGYLSYTLNLKNYALKAGGRYEHTAIEAEYKTGQILNIPSYYIFVPSFNASRKFENGSMVKAAFNRRIQRPSIQYLNPNVQASNPFNITVGNPNLRPEFTNNYEISYNTNIKSTSVSLSGFMRNTRASIQSLRNVIGQDTIQTTYRNIGKQDAYGFNLFLNINVSNKFSINGGPDLYYAVLSNNVPDPLYNAKNSGWVLSGRIFGNYNFSKSWGLQLFSFYRGRQVQLQGYQGGFGIYSLSLKKDFDNKKGSIGFGAENFFTPSYRINARLNSPILDQSSTSVIHLLNFKINFSYKIGNGSNANNKRRKSINNEDLKEGSDNSPAGGGGGGGPAQGGGGGGAPRQGPPQKPSNPK